jgi:Ca2+-binding EF-hand superfamily protein
MKRMFFPALLAAGLLCAAGPEVRSEKKAPGPSDVQDVVYFDAGGPVLIRLHLRLDDKPFRQVWDEFIAGLFAYLDTDKDGVLNKAEAARIPSTARLFAGGVYFNNRDTPAVDGDKDGKVTRAELGRYYRTHGAAPFQIGSGRANPGAGYNFIDRAVISGGSASATQINQALFKLLDTDKDGRLSRKELKASPAILRRQDRSDDEMVDVDELLPERGSSAGDGVFIVASGMPLGMPAASHPAFHVIDPEDRAALGAKLLRHYGKSKGKTPKAALTRDDIGLDAKTFAALDADRDGKLDAKELAGFAGQAPDVELVVRIGKKPAGKKGVEVVASKDGSPVWVTEAKSPAARRVVRVAEAKSPVALRLTVGTTRIDLTVGASSGGMGGITFRVEDQFKGQFKAADRDNNGYLDKAEAQRTPFFRNSFERMDRDGDGMLYAKEMNAYIAKSSELRDLARKGVLSLGITDKGRGLFEVIDGDGDGRLSERELRALPARVGKLDRGGDGKVHPDEIPRRYQANFVNGPAGVSGGGGGFVAVAINRGSPLRPQPAPRGEGPVWFQKMDRNRDGDVSRREFLGKSEDFRKIDVDGDGLIDPKEAERADK